MKAHLSEKGQITIPKALRAKLGLRPGAVIDFVARDGALIGTKEIEQDVFRKWRGRGRLPGGGSVDDYLRRIRSVDADRG